MTATASADGAEGPAQSVDPESDGDADGDAARASVIDRVTDRIDRVQRRFRPVAVTFAVTKKFGDDRGGQLAMLLAYRGFFSLFPLVLAFVNVLALILQNNDALRQDLIDSTLSAVPVIGEQIQEGANAFEGSTVVVTLSILFSIWAGLGLLEMLQESMNTVWDVAMVDRPPFLIRKLKALPGAVVIVICAALSGSATWLFRGSPSIVGDIGKIVLPLAAGALCFVALHRLMCARATALRSLLPGAALVGVAWWALYALGTWYVNRIVAQSSDTYGVFVVVFGLLSWCYLLGMLFLYGHELCVVLLDRRWPRSLTGRNLTDQDQDSLTMIATREVRVRGTDIDVTVPRNPLP